MYLTHQQIAIITGVTITLAVVVCFLTGVLLRQRRLKREREQREYSPETDDPVLLRTQIDKLQPCLVQMKLDGVDELRDLRESERAELRAGLEALLEEWAAQHEGLFSRLEDDRYQLLVQQPMLRRMVQAKFDVLDTVRAYQFRGRRVDVTVSIGVGHGSSFAECGENSRRALDLALGRGGDQAVVKNPDLSFQFFGGVSKRVEKSGKVKVRMMATAFAELMRGCEQVYVMGHKRADFDSLGAAAGVCALARAQGKPAYVVIDCDSCMAQPMLDSWHGQEGVPALLTARKALAELSARTLVVLVDTHLAAQAECPQLIEQAKMLAVIDHHRQTAEHIQTAQLFYLDPGVSSCCEMVAELAQYTLPAPNITPLHADALLAGIQLDTRNFVLRTGISTFEAAAFLRSKGADPTRVRRLFAGEHQSVKRRMEIMSRAKIINRCAVSIARPKDGEDLDLRLLCAQAADEMLNLEQVDAAFVLHEDGQNIHISARSLGERNVQLIMESLGGGGHQTMAAAQLPLAKHSMEDALRLLVKALEE